jgi:hypothetical protein
MVYQYGPKRQDQMYDLQQQQQQDQITYYPAVDRQQRHQRQQYSQQKQRYSQQRPYAQTQYIMGQQGQFDDWDQSQFHDARDDLIIEVEKIEDGLKTYQQQKEKDEEIAIDINSTDSIFKKITQYLSKKENKSINEFFEIIFGKKKLTSRESKVSEADNLECIEGIKKGFEMFKKNTKINLEKIKNFIHKNQRPFYYFGIFISLSFLGLIFKDEISQFILNLFESILTAICKLFWNIVSSISHEFSQLFQDLENLIEAIWATILWKINDLKIDSLVDIKDIPHPEYPLVIYRAPMWEKKFNLLMFLSKFDYLMSLKYILPAILLLILFIPDRSASSITLTPPPPPPPPPTSASFPLIKWLLTPNAPPAPRPLPPSPPTAASFPLIRWLLFPTPPPPVPTPAPPRATAPSFFLFPTPNRQVPRQAPRPPPTPPRNPTAPMFPLMSALFSKNPTSTKTRVQTSIPTRVQTRTKVQTTPTVKTQKPAPTTKQQSRRHIAPPPYYTPDFLPGSKHRPKQTLNAYRGMQHKGAFPTTERTATAYFNTAPNTTSKGRPGIPN